MDGERFDGLARRFAGVVPRRAVFGAAVGVLLGRRDAMARGPVASQCIPVGGRCGDGKPACRRCCSRHTVRAGKVRRCACKADGQRCNNSSQCCGGRCAAGTCGVTETTFAVRATGTAKATKGARCERTPGGCTYAVTARLTDGYPFAAVTIVAHVEVTRHVRAEDRRYTAFAVATVEVVEKTTLDRVVLEVEAEVAGRYREVTFVLDGSYAVIEGDGRYRDATGNGTAKFVVERGRITSLNLAGEILRATG